MVYKAFNKKYSSDAIKIKTILNQRPTGLARVANVSDRM